MLVYAHSMLACMVHPPPTTHHPCASELDGFQRSLQQ